MTFKAFVDDAGFFALDDSAAFSAYIQKFKGCVVTVSVKKQDRRQGSQSMRYYRGVVIPAIARACGYTDPDEFQQVHDGLAWKFLRLPDGPFGEPRRKSTAKDQMPQAEMTAYIDAVILYAETTIPGCHVPRPDEVDMDEVFDPGWVDEEAA